MIFFSRLHTTALVMTLLTMACLALTGLLAGCGAGDDGASGPVQPDTTAALATPVDPSTILQDNSGGADWPAYGRTYGEQHHSPLAAINADNVERLGLAWSLDLGPGNTVTAPLAVDGVLYTATGYSIVRAIDATTGKVLWQFDPDVPGAAGKRLRQGWGSRGLAYWDGKIYTGTLDGRLIALDAASGDILWSAMTLDEGAESRYISGAPRVFDGKVVIGHGGADRHAIRGYVTTYDAETGEQLWRFHTVPGNPADGFENDAMAMAAKTWHGEWWQYGGGGTVWNAMTYDAEQELIILGTGNGYPWNHRIRSEGEGDNLFLSSIVALDANSGDYRWHYQTNPGESWDYNASMDMQLAELDIGGERRKVLMTAPKNGFFYVIDRTTGKLISAEPIARVTWASHIDLATGRPVENPQARFPDDSSFEMWPSFMGAHNWYPMAFSPETGLAYIPVTEMGATYTDAGVNADNFKSLPGQIPNYGLKPRLGVSEPDPLHGTSALLAWNPVTQSEAWRVANPGPFNGGVLSTAGNLVFQGRVDRAFNAYAADSGKLLWSFPAQAAILAPPITYQADGRQYVTVLTGMGVSASIFGELMPESVDYRTEPKRILTFALDGDGTLPPSPPVNKRAIDDPDFEEDADRAQRGGQLFAARDCYFCHGANVVGSGHAPDLRTSGMVLSAEAFATVVRDGALRSRGMPGFEEISDEDLDDLRHYIRTAAAKLREQQGD